MCDAALMVEKLKSEQHIDDDQAQQLQEILMRPHKHKHRKVGRKLQDGTDQSTSSPAGSPSSGPVASKGRRFKPQKRQGKEVVDALRSFPVGANPNALEDYKVRLYVYLCQTRQSYTTIIIVGLMMLCHKQD